MNCRAFRDLLHEYLDETLDPRAQAAARRHLEQCDACRGACLAEQALAASVRRTLGEAVAGVSLRPGMRRDILEALEARPGRRGAWAEALGRLAALRSRAALAALLAVAAASLCVVFYRRAPHPGAAQARMGPSVNVPLLTRTHVFRLQGNTVVDSVVDEPSVADAGDSEGARDPSQRAQPDHL